MSAREDAIDALADTLDALADELHTSEVTIKRSEKNRLGLLHVHAVFACFIAPLFAAIGQKGMTGPTWTVVRVIPGAPFSLAVVLLAGGVILGLATWYRHVNWEIVGLWILMAWYATIACSFAGAVLLWLAAGRPGNSQPNFYPAAVYGHVCVILAVHQNTLMRIRRGLRRDTP